MAHSAHSHVDDVDSEDGVEGDVGHEEDIGHKKRGNQ